MDRRDVKMTPRGGGVSKHRRQKWKKGKPNRNGNRNNNNKQRYFNSNKNNKNSNANQNGNNQTPNENGDTDSNTMLIDSVNSVLQQKKHNNNSNQKDKPSSISNTSNKNNKKRQKIKEKFSEKFAQQRAIFDKRIRDEPHKLLWEQYVTWAGDRLTKTEKSDEWSVNQIVCVQDDDPGGTNIMNSVKQVIGPDYSTRTEFKGLQNEKYTTPSVACIMMALTTESVLAFARRLYDGKQVGKFFSRHFSVEQQSEFLKKSCADGIMPTAVGTTSRLHRLISEGFLTLDFTQALLIDFSRDAKLFNFTDQQYREGFFNFIHSFVRPRIASGMKVVVVIPSESKMPTERTWGSKKGDGKNQDQHAHQDEAGDKMMDEGE